jgi:hypothetical protein
MNIRSSTRSLVLDVNRYQLGKRRSVRMTLKTAVGLSGHDHQKCPFTLPANATNLNRYGAAVEVNRELSVGSTIVVRNKFGTQLSARIVAQIKAAETGTRTYGIEFVEHDDSGKDFWGITFPTD